VLKGPASSIGKVSPLIGVSMEFSWSQPVKIEAATRRDRMNGVFFMCWSRLGRAKVSENKT